MESDQPSDFIYPSRLSRRRHLDYFTELPSAQARILASFAATWSKRPRNPFRKIGRSPATHLPSFIVRSEPKRSSEGKSSRESAFGRRRRELTNCWEDKPKRAKPRRNRAQWGSWNRPR